MTQNVCPLPVINLARLEEEGSGRPALLRQLREAAHQFGFFYLTGHNVPAFLNVSLLSQMRDFFSLPLGSKEEISMVHSPHFRGYSRAGQELTRGKPDWREQIDIGAEREAIPDIDGKPSYLRLQGPNQWPEATPGLREAALLWQEATLDVLRRLLRQLAVTLEQRADVFNTVVDDNPYQLLKLIHYPGHLENAEGQGVGPHKDSDLLSLILQGDEDGLEVELPSGAWIKAPPREGTFVVNIGELLEVATDGYFRAAVHRVVSPPSGRERLSAAFFLGAQLDATVPALRLPRSLSASSKGITRDPENPLFSQIGQNTLKGRLRSHPDVARRHHADLVGLPD